MRIASGTTDQIIYFFAADAADFNTPETGLSSFTVYRSRNTTTATAMTTPTITQVDASNMPGIYTLLMDEDMTIGSGNDTEEMIFFITHAGMAPVRRVIELYRPKITAGYTLGVASDGDLLEVNTLTGHTVQTGDNYARLGAPAGASVSADIAGLNDPTAAAIADAVWEEAIADHSGTAGSTAEALDDASGVTAAAIADEVWNELLAGHLTSGSAGKALSEAGAVPSTTSIATAVWADWLANKATYVGGTEVAGTPGSTASGPYIKRGDSWEQTFTIGAAIGTRTKLWFTLKTALDDADSAALIQIEETTGLVYINGGAAGTPANGDITVLDADTGEITVTLDEVETAKITPATGLHWDFQWFDGTDMETSYQGSNGVVSADVTRATS